MIFFTRLLLIFSLLVPAAPINSSAQKLPEDCVVCGHACCCPEMCKPLIKKMKEDAASHCSMQRSQKQSKVESCDQPNSICRLQRAPPAGILNLKNEAAWPNPRLAILGDVNPSSGRSKESIFESSLFLSFLAPLEIPTPPPRISPF